MTPPAAPNATPAGATDLDDAHRAGSLILVAEDDAPSRDMLARQLAHLGLAAELAADGAEALGRWRAGGHALLLTDLEMPELDGCGLARAIRAAEAADGGRPRLPIVAITAVERGAAEALARAAGIDACLAKPIEPGALRAALVRWLPASAHSPAMLAEADAEVPAEAPPRAARPTPAAAGATFDVAVLRALLGDEELALRDFLAHYRRVSARQGAEIGAACAAHDLRGAAAVAHKLKASSRSVGALALGALCDELERAGQAGEAEGVELACAGFGPVLAAAHAEIDLYLATPA